MRKVEDRFGEYNLKEGEILLDPYLGQEYKMKVGGTKFDEGKLRYNLTPPEPLEQLAQVYTHGAKKYGDHNWKKGIDISRMYAALMRHLEKHRMGEVMDPEGHSHMSAVAFYAFALMWSDHNIKVDPELSPTVQKPWQDGLA